MCQAYFGSRSPGSEQLCGSWTTSHRMWLRPHLKRILDVRFILQARTSRKMPHAQTTLANYCTVDFIGLHYEHPVAGDPHPLHKNVPHAYRTKNLFEVTHAAQLGAVSVAVIVTSQQLVPNTGRMYIMATGTLYLALGIEQISRDSSSECARLRRVFQRAIQGRQT